MANKLNPVPISTRNRDAVADVKKTADALLKLPDNEKDRETHATYLYGKSIFYQKYAAVVDAMRN